MYPFCPFRPLTTLQQCTHATGTVRNIFCPRAFTEHVTYSTEVCVCLLTPALCWALGRGGVGGSGAERSYKELKLWFSLGGRL